MPACPGTGIIAGGPIRKIIELAGIKDILSKSLGNNNKVTNSKAAIKALSSLKDLPWVKKKLNTQKAQTEKTVKKEKSNESKTSKKTVEKDNTKKTKKETKITGKKTEKKVEAKKKTTEKKETKK